MLKCTTWARELAPDARFSGRQQGRHLRIVAVYDDTEVDLAIGDITTDA